MSIIKDFVEKTLLALGSHVNESTLFDNTIGARPRLNSVHLVALLSLRFLPNFKSHKLLTSFHVSLIMVVLL